MIVDIHVHLGWDFTFDEDFTKAALLEKMAHQKDTIQIVQPGTCHDLASVQAQHNAIAALGKKYPGHFFGMAHPSPHLTGTAYQDEIARCIEELAFIGIKIHPMATGVNPGSKAGRKAFEAARKYHVPLMVHTGSGLPFAGPVNLLTLAGEYPEVKIIMAHCGQIILANEAAAVLAACPNVYGDTSWSPGFILREWTKHYGPRLMLGSDHADNFATELAKIRTVGFAEDEQAAILARTALQVFNLRLPAS